MKRLYMLLATGLLALSMSLFVSCGGSSGCSDDDGDGYGDNCDKGLDCNDDDASIYQGAPELCDGQDNQCPGDTGYGQIDEGCP